MKTRLLAVVGCLALGGVLWAAVQGRTPETDWSEVAQAHVGEERLEKARWFLERHPHSRQADQARYLLANDAFRQGRYQAFLDYGQEPLERFDTLLSTQPEQSARWLQLLAQTAFYLAESGRGQEALERAQQLLDVLERVPPPPNLSRLQWQQNRDRLLATGLYSRGRIRLAQGLSAQDQDQRRLLQQAAHDLQEAVKVQPSDAYAHYRLGLAFRHLGRTEKSWKALASAAALPGPAQRPAAEMLRDTFDAQLAGEDLPRYFARCQEQLKAALKERPRAVFALRDGAPHQLLWWDGVPEEVRRQALDEDGYSNIRPGDYAGPEACKDCHSERYEAWSQHSHRWMNARVSEAVMKGDFSGRTMRYRGGEVRFYRGGATGKDGDGDASEGARSSAKRSETAESTSVQDHAQAWYMRLERDGVVRRYRVRRTLGSRFYQYYVGVLEEGPEGQDHIVRREDHLLPFGYWIEEREWVPVVHISSEKPDEERNDPFAHVASFHYDRSCSACHTTRPLGDWLLTSDGRLRSGQFSPREFSVDMSSYLAQAHPRLLPERDSLQQVDMTQVSAFLEERINYLPAEDYAVTLGVSCEACHNGARQHARRSRPESSDLMPRFFPSSPHVLINSQESSQEAWGRNNRNLNWTCARCHSGGRPRFAGGMDTWNSTEYSDASRGACYDPDQAQEAGMSSLTCVHCHDPHYTIGRRWDRPPRRDDAQCLECHRDLRQAESRRLHTRHEAETPGDRCMNCHMPRINEGLQDMVRTHHIFSPTNREMMEAGQPNACNMCHVDKPIDWTLDYLRQWYQAEFDASRIEASYPRRQESAVVNWLASSHEATRLVASDVLTRAKARWALPHLIEMLDDPFLINRQFTQRGLERMLDVELEDFGYRFYQFESERREPLKKIRDDISR
ncbi:MAG TPA: multiheme c-type cytochrome [Acidobacteriota bacterium]|nr:multiheme c-type cytochrome [Acidobacteriota bacterium]